MQDYTEFLNSKKIVVKPVGIEADETAIHDALFPFQKPLVKWALRKGRCALFADTGLGKTVMQLEWAKHIAGERGKVLILAPLTVARQTVNEAKKLLDMDLRYIRSDDGMTSDCQFYITNYEMVDRFTPSKFVAVVLDESSILKSLMGKTKQLITDMFKDTPYRLCATATPAPNDIKEIASHSEFLGIMSRAEMLSIFFTYDNAGGTTKATSWRIKNYAVQDFYRWLASWGMAVRKPSDIGFSDEGYDLPPLNIQMKAIHSDYSPPGMLPGFLVGGISATDARKIRRETLDVRAEYIAEMVNNDSDQWIVWCGLNDESDTLEKMITDAKQVKGSQTPDEKMVLLQDWQDGKYRVLVTKTSIAGMGMNFQNAHKMCFAGLDYSWEAYYQAIRRQWRFGQAKPVDVHIVISEQERDVYNAVMRKDKQAREMMQQLTDESAQYSKAEIQGAQESFDYRQDEKSGNGWRLWLGDSTERMSEIPDESVDLSVYSPPFSDLFVYSATPRDMGNSRGLDEFFQHYGFIIRENYRITKPGRLCCVHITDLRLLKSHDGVIGRRDFSGMTIEAYQKAGWIFWQRITIDKNPQAQAIRMKDHGLLFKTLMKDSTMLAGGHPDFVLVFKKPGENKVPVLPFQNGEMTNDDWIKWAHPVWTDINETRTLNERIARTDKDEKHMCPLQLDVIERCVRLWSNKGEMVFSPFAGVGSEGYEALRWKREFLGIELKPEYYKVACMNLENAEKLNVDLFTWAEQQTDTKPEQSTNGDKHSDEQLLKFKKRLLGEVEAEIDDATESKQELTDEINELETSLTSGED